ncbi:MAG: hypothetical protein K6F33_01275 [Bacteroidales bacterium]|nr:hypothetical protein [Bacteroidales bacterium]
MINEIANIGTRLIGDATGLVKSTFDNLADDNKISDKENKSIFENIKRKLFDKSADLESSIKELLYKFYEKMDYATPEEVDKLRRRIAILEKLTQNN